MMRRLVLVLIGLAVAWPAQAATGEWPERIRRQKEILQALGYFGGPVDMQDTDDFARARAEFARDAAVSADIPIMFASQMERIYERNLQARGKCAVRSGKATACPVSSASGQ
jgi:hypothetical protein